MSKLKKIDFLYIGIITIYLGWLIHDYMLMENLSTDTNRSIVYYTSIFVGILLIIFQKIVRSKNKIMTSVYIAFFIVTLMKLIPHISCINLKYEQYRTIIRNPTCSIISSCLFVILICISAWQYFSKRGNSTYR